MPSINDNTATADLNLIQNQNISKLFDSDGNALSPSAYEIEEINIFNIYGQERDIKRLVTGFTFVEELFSPVIMCYINIRDDENLFEEYNLQTQEKIQINIKFKNPLDEVSEKTKSLKLEFYIKEIPNFRKITEAANLQEYNIVAISTFAYTSQLTKISRAVPNPVGESDGNPLIEIKEIFEKNLLFSPIAAPSSIQSRLNPSSDFENDSNAKFLKEKNHYPSFIMLKNASYDAQYKFIGNITYRTPLAAVEFLRTKAYDSFNTPFFVYNKIGDSVNLISDSGPVVVIQSLTSLLDDQDNPVYYPNGDEDPYNYTPGFITHAGSTSDNSKPPSLNFQDRKDYIKQLKKRILDINANLDINKLKQANDGVYGNRIEVCDYQTHSYTSLDFDPYKSESDDILDELKPAVEYRPFGNIWFHDDDEESSIELGYQPQGPDDPRPAGAQVVAEESKITKYSTLFFNLPAPQNDTNATNGLYTASEIYSQTLSLSRYYYSRLQDDRNLEIELYGDFNLNPGVKIEILCPKAMIDPGTEEDKIISGTYLIIAANHQFSEGVYICNLKLVKLIKE